MWTKTLILPLYPHDSLKHVINRVETIMGQVRPVNLILKEYIVGGCANSLFYNYGLHADFRSKVLVDSGQPLLLLLGDLHHRWCSAGGTQWFQIHNVHTRHKLVLQPEQSLSSEDRHKLSRMQSLNLTDKQLLDKQLKLQLSHSIFVLEEQTRNKWDIRFVFVTEE